MRFLGKYELLEQLTVGTVETFAAYPIGGGERLLVHVFALPAMIKSGLKNSDLLVYMEAMAPPAMGSLIDAGRYDDGSQAFVVTKFPRDLKALPTWVEAYKLMSKKQDTTTVETPVRHVWADPSSDAQPAKAAAEAPVGEFTRAFRSPTPGPETSKPTSATDSFDSLSTPATPTPAPREILDRAVPPETYAVPKVEHRELTGRLGEGARLPRSTPPAPFVTKADLTPAPIGSTGAIPWDADSESPSQEQLSSTARTGEFTMFFKSPLAPSPASIPEPLAEPDPFQPMARPSKGEFTQMFGSSSQPVAASPLASEPLLEPAAQRENFTDIFGKAPIPDASPVLTPPRNLQVKPESSIRPIFAEDEEEEDTSQIQLSKSVPEPAFNANVSFGNSNPGPSMNEGATRLFRPPVQEVPAPEPPPGESEYSRIISAKAKPAELEGAPKQASAGGGSPKLSIPVVAPLPIPAMSVPPPVAPLHFPPAPVIPTPNLAMTPPPGPKAGKKTGKKPGGWTAYAPLIIILNLLLLAAVSLVLYFILKH